MREKKEYMELARFAVEEAKRQGADETEAFISDRLSVSINVSNREVEQVNSYRDAGIGLRLFDRKKQVFGSSNELSRDSIRSLISDLLRKVAFHTPDEFNTLTGKEGGTLEKDWSSYPDLLSYDPQLAEIPVSDKIKRALAMEGAGLDFSPKVTGSMFAMYQDTCALSYLANSRGISGWFPSSGCQGFVIVSAAEGSDHQSGTYSKGYARYSAFSPEEVGRKAAENAVRMLGAKPIASCEVPMVISPSVGVELLTALVYGMLCADSVQQNQSILSGKLGSTVASDIVTLTDDGRLKGAMNTSPVDGEGVPLQTTPLIAGGVLKNYLYDSYTARKGKTKSTGNRRRPDGLSTGESSYQSAGWIGITNLYLDQGILKPEEIVSTVSNGFYLNGAHGLNSAGINYISGDFSLPVSGFMIEGGTITYPVSGISIGGNLLDLLQSVDKIGNDLTWFTNVGCPTFSVNHIKISGAENTGK